MRVGGIEIAANIECCVRFVSSFCMLQLENQLGGIQPLASKTRLLAILA